MWQKESSVKDEYFVMRKWGDAQAYIVERYTKESVKTRLNGELKLYPEEIVYAIGLFEEEYLETSGWARVNLDILKRAKLNRQAYNFSVAQRQFNHHHVNDEQRDTGFRVENWLYRHPGYQGYDKSKTDYGKNDWRS